MVQTDRGGEFDEKDDAMDARLGERDMNRLRWRCRRGLLENDLFIEAFFRRHGRRLSVRRADALHALMELPDNDLLDLLLRRSEPQGELDRPDVREVLMLMRRPPPVYSSEGTAS